MRLRATKKGFHRFAAFLMKPILFVLLPILGCGEEIAPPTTPPVAEWCDVDRSREDCEAGNIYINDGNLDEARLLCMTPCTRARAISIGGGDAELFKALKGFKTAGSLNIFDSHESVKDLDAFREITQASHIRISDNPGLESLAGLENLVRVVPPEDSEFELTGEYKIEISGNPNLKSVSSLKNLETVGSIMIFGNHSLKVIEGLNALTVGGLRVEYNNALTRISGFEAMKTRGSLAILTNNNLKTIDGFQNLTQVDYLRAYRNLGLDECQVQRIVDQLDEPPDTLEIIENGKPCD